MIVSVRHRLVVLSMPKCASTAIDEALAPHADVVIRHPPALKHMTYGRFMKSLMPMLESVGLRRRDLEVVSLMREPLDWLGSWHRYRARPALQDSAHPNHQHYTGGIPFEHFVDAYLSEHPPPFARVGDPVRFLSRGDRGKTPEVAGVPFPDIGPDRTFRYEDGAWVDFLRERVHRGIAFPRANISPKRDLGVDPKWRERLWRHYRVYDALTEDGRIAHQAPLSAGRG